MQETEAGDVGSWIGKIPWRRKWQPTSVFLPEKLHGQRSLADCSPRAHKESDTTEQVEYILILESILLSKENGQRVA